MSSFLSLSLPSSDLTQPPGRRLRLRRIVMLGIGIVCAGLALAAAAADDEYADSDTVAEALRVTTTEDLAALGVLAQEKGVPILLMFSTEDCGYCKRLEAEVLGPMRKAGVDPQRVILRKVMLDSYGSLRDFSGHKRSAESFGTRRGIDVVPTLELVDAGGKPLVPKIVGYQTPGLYDEYLDQAIDVSLSLLGQ